ncbi:O-acyltransferase like protein-like [Choristoneura fumiferana]|uniref:O-acyltransferase like protein-like n=1 Tax=Choristoneura fumiferana TaxID=7141 RepID=UPI003D15E9B3
MIQASLTPPVVRIPSLTGVFSLCVFPSRAPWRQCWRPTLRTPVVGFNYTEQYCRLPHDKPFVAADYVAVIVFSVLGILTFISTAYELRHIFILKREPSQASVLLRTCSLYSNTRRLLTFDRPRALDCLDGIRSLSILLIIVFHTFYLYFYSARNVANSFEVHQWLRKKQAVWILSGDIGVDSFFTLSGLLLVYTSVNKMTQTSLLRSLPWFYLSRFLRLFPLLAAAVLLQASLIHRVADGPGWHGMAKLVGNCRRYWWSALLHVQNIVNLRHTCVPVSWYLSVDMQLHVVSPLVLFWVLGSRRAAWAALAAALLASLAATLAFVFPFHVFSISLLAQEELMGDIGDYWIYCYCNLFVRSPPFFIGMLFGYVLHVFKGEKMKLPQWVIITCHALSFATFFYVVYIVHPCMQADWDNHFADSMNNSFRRSGWSLALCWMILACVHGYGGPVNWFLSLRLWKFVARISYAMYLYHYLIQKINTTAAFTPVYFNMETLFKTFATDLVYTVIISTTMCVFIEEPALTLQKMLLQGVSKQQRQEHEEKNDPMPLDEMKDVNVEMKC